MKALLAREEAGHPHLFANILHAIRPIMTEGRLPEIPSGRRRGERPPDGGDG
jgi:hypothetical protein